MITLQKYGDSAVKFVFENSQHYLYGNGEIVVPVNSLILVEDSSEMATFKKPDGDVFVSATYAEFGKTKSELLDWYKTNMVGQNGGGGVTSGEVETLIDASISGKADVSAITNFFGAVNYDSNTKRINFYNESTTGQVLAYVDATDFIKDGMVDNVEIKTISGTSYLAITFNSDSGKEEIDISLTDIFDPSNYYNKQEVDNLVSAATDDMATQTWVGEQGYITGVDLSNYAEISAVTAVNNALTAHTSDDEIHVNGESKQYWDSKSDFSGSYNDLTDKPTIPTVPTSNTAFTNDAGYITADALSATVATSAITTAVTSASTDAQIPTAKAVYDAIPTGGTSITIDPTLNSGSTNAVANSAITNAINEIEEVSAAAFNALNDELSGKQDTLIAGDNITISGNVISASGGGGNNVVEVTQAEYDALVSAGTLDLTALYVITDAAAINVSGFVATSAITTAVTSASTNDEIPSALAVYAATSGGSGGGGSTYTAGRGISIDTANTISFSLPISADSEVRLLAGTGNTYTYTTNNIIIGNGNTAKGTASNRVYSGGTIIGYNNTVGCTGVLNTANTWSTIIGKGNIHNGGNSYIIGLNNKFEGYTSYKRNFTYVFGRENGENGINSDSDNIFVFGAYNKVSKSGEFALGMYNASSKDNTTSGDTFFSIGNGTADNARHNAFEIRQNGDIYISSGGTDIKLQDNLGGGDASSAVTSGDTNAVAGGAVFEQLGGLKFVSLTQTEYNNLQNKDANTLYIITSGQTCTPTSSAFTQVNGNVSDLVYELKFDFGGIQGSYESGSLQADTLIDTTTWQSGFGGYGVSCIYDDMNDLTSVSIDSGGTEIYTAETAGSSITVDLCQVFGQGMYIVEDSVPNIQTCGATECTEYDCLEWDEETGECIEQGDCIQEECVSWIDNYVMYVKF